MTRLAKLFLYMTCDLEGLDEVQFVPERDVLSLGGIEQHFRRNYIWFYPLGELLVRVKGTGYMIEVALVAPLLQAWERAGSPKIPGAQLNHS